MEYITMHKRNITILSLAGVAALAASVILTSSVTIRSEGVYMTDGPSYNDLTDLTRASQAVAQVKVVSAAKSYRVAFDRAQVVVAPRPSDGAKGKEQPAAAAPAAIIQEEGLLHTDFTVEVVEAVRGGLQKGQRLVVTQIGGTEDSGAKLNAEHDPLMQVGTQEVLFLKKDAKSGKFFTTGGGQGRFTVQSNGTVSPVDAHTELARVTTGKPATFVTGAAKAAP
jgi:hypothetical protein